MILTALLQFQRSGDINKAQNWGFLGFRNYRVRFGVGMLRLLG